MQLDHLDLEGLSEMQVLESRAKFGMNKLSIKEESGIWNALKSLAREPMVILLFIASTIYFISGQIGDGIFLASGIVLVSAISLYQDARSRSALEKLKEYTKPACTVIRGTQRILIPSEEIVVGDYLMVEEGATIVADGIIIQANDYSVNEAILTGESLPVFKDKDSKDNLIFSGTTVVTGLCIAKVTEVGMETNLGKIGKSLESIKEEKTPLELQILNFVKRMAILGLIVFIIVWLINYFQSYNVLDSLLKALTLAMSILPEEIPVAFATFMALGAWRLMKLGIVVKQMKTVETLGSATIVCIDKTGTITENRMSLVNLYVHSTNSITHLEKELNEEEKELIRLAMWASEPIPFDQMEIALHDEYSKFMDVDERAIYKMIHEYPLGGKPPMMTHIFETSDGQLIIAAKGAAEALIHVSELTEKEQMNIENAIHSLAGKGYRVLGVGQAIFSGNDFPKTQQQFKFLFKGLVAFYDPPKKNIHSVLASFYKAGIAVKIVTGDNDKTTTAIAQKIEFKNYHQQISGEELMKLSDLELQHQIKNISVFTRMFPEAKLKIINAFKLNNEVVAMIGDGVNDGPALKASHIGVAMGKKGTEIAKNAASLILVDDDLGRMVDAVAMGRKIYTNLKKAIQYIISIHIPIILTVFIPLAFGWVYPNIFTPVHIIFLELIMGPTCSIIYENEPMEENTMIQKPRPYSNTFFNWKELTTSIVQGLMITLGSLIAYQYAVFNEYSEAATRTMVFTVLISANIFLTLVNRSFYYSVYTTLSYKNNLVLLIIGITVLITALLLYIKPLTHFFYLETLTCKPLLISILIGFVSVIWYEGIKWRRRSKTKNRK